MDFTREPVIQTVITPREGCKLVIRSSKGLSQEEYFVDAVEIATIGSALFFRSLEKPKCFLLPATDYEVIEVREARLVLKHVGLDRSIKISGGREAPMRTSREQAQEKVVVQPEMAEELTLPKSEEESVEPSVESAPDKRRERRRNYRRRRGGEETEKEEKSSIEAKDHEPREEIKIAPPPISRRKEKEVAAPALDLPGVITPRPVLPPPSTLISETIARYREDSLFKNAFYTKEESEALEKQVESDLSEKEAGSVSAQDQDIVEGIESPEISSSTNILESADEPEDLWDFTDELSRNNQDKDR